MSPQRLILLLWVLACTVVVVGGQIWMFEHAYNPNLDRVEAWLSYSWGILGGAAVNFYSPASCAPLNAKRSVWAAMLLVMLLAYTLFVIRTLLPVLLHDVPFEVAATDTSSVGAYLKYVVLTMFGKVCIDLRRANTKRK